MSTLAVTCARGAVRRLCPGGGDSSFVSATTGCCSWRNVLSSSTSSLRLQPNPQRTLCHILDYSPPKPLMPSENYRFSATRFRPSPSLPVSRQFLAHSPNRRSYSTAHSNESAIVPNYEEPTIYALSTAPGRAAIAVIRVSGPACLDIYRALCPGKKTPKPRVAVVRRLLKPGTDLAAHDATQVLDSGALVLYFPAPHTVTGEDVLEFHVHGGPAVVRAVLAAIPLAQTLPGPTAKPIRYAEAGEFTRRAFLNNRLDLTQAEALGDTLAATTEHQRTLSIRSGTGALSARYETWRRRLLAARAELEALIDFSEDQHFDESPAMLCASVAEQVRALRHVLRVYRTNAVRGELLRHGISVCLLGAPNAGKSSLLNRVVGREAAIVSAEAGTTRDVVEVGLDLDGFFCRVGDTAGLRKALERAVAEGTGTVTTMATALSMAEQIGGIEREGMRRAKARAEESDVVLVVLSFEPGVCDDTGVGGVSSSSTTTRLHLDAEVIETAAALVRDKDNVVVAINKADVVAHSSSATEIQDLAIRQTLAALPGLDQNKIVLISCKEAESEESTATNTSTSTSTSTPTPSSDDPGNIQTLLQTLTTHFRTLTTALVPPASTSNLNPGGDDGLDADPSIWQASLGASERHRVLLEQGVGFLDAFLTCIEDADGGDDVDIVVAAEHLRGAADCLAGITGKGHGSGDVEEVLGVVFEKFCVGK